VPPFMGWVWIFQEGFPRLIVWEDDEGRRQLEDSFIDGTYGQRATPPQQV